MLWEKPKMMTYTKTAPATNQSLARHDAQPGHIAEAFPKTRRDQSSQHRTQDADDGIEASTNVFQRSGIPRPKCRSRSLKFWSNRILMYSAYVWNSSFFGMTLFSDGFDMFQMRPMLIFYSKNAAKFHHHIRRLEDRNGQNALAIPGSIGRQQLLLGPVAFPILGGKVWALSLWTEKPGCDTRFNLKLPTICPHGFLMVFAWFLAHSFKSSSNSFRRWLGDPFALRQPPLAGIPSSRWPRKHTRNGPAPHFHRLQHSARWWQP